MRNYIDSYWDRLADSALCELVELFKDKISWPDLSSGRESRDRIFNQWRTFWIFLGQVISHSQGCIEALRKAQAWLWNKKKSLPTRLLSANPEVELSRNVWIKSTRESSSSSSARSLPSGCGVGGMSRWWMVRRCLCLIQKRIKSYTHNPVAKRKDAVFR